MVGSSGPIELRVSNFPKLIPFCQDGQLSFVLVTFDEMALNQTKKKMFLPLEFNSDSKEIFPIGTLKTKINKNIESYSSH